MSPVRGLNAPVTQDYAERVYLYPLPYINVPATCNCVQFAKNMGIRNEPIDKPIIGGSVKLAEGSVGHRAVIIQFVEGGFIIVESNYVSCQKTYRFISYDYNKIIGYTN